MILLCLSLARCWFVEFWLGSLLLVGRLGVGAVVAGAGGGQLEGLDGEGEVLVIGIVDQEPVVNRVRNSASKRSIRRFVITEKAPILGPSPG